MAQVTERWNVALFIELLLLTIVLFCRFFYPAKLEYWIQFLTVLSFLFLCGAEQLTVPCTLRRWM